MLEIVPMTLREANAFVEQKHRHHGPVTGHKFSIGLSNGEEIVGVAIVGRPVARHLDDGWTLEVNRLCTDGSRNACSMADLFGRWVPTDWIRDVLDACRRAPQHRYIFLTKNPARYLELDHLALLPHENNFWYGSTVANEDAAAMYPMPWANINSFWSMEPLLGPVDMSVAEGLPMWVILGAETGNRTDKVVPRREWVDQIAAFCKENEIPVFYKDNLRAYFPDLPASKFPWDEPAAKWAAHYMGRFERQV